MAENETAEGGAGEGGAAAAAGEAPAPEAQPPEAPAPRTDTRVAINTQYIKDLSFENPNAPRIYAQREGHRIEVGVEVRAVHLQDRHYEVQLGIKATAEVKETTAFIVELDFAALVTVGETVAADEIEALLSVEVPRYLFPFARGVVAEVTRDGGYPPLLINPVDFSHLYRQRTDGPAGA